MGGHSYAYDGDGRRIAQTVSGIATEYLLDIQPGLAQVVAAATGGSTERYIHGPRGIQAQEDSSGVWTHTQPDGLGSVRGVISDALAVNGIQHFAPFGNSLSVQGSVGMDFGFTGEQTDGNGQVYLRARYYNPGIGVFTSFDPYEGIIVRAMSLNGYSWVEGNVANAVDPSGLLRREQIEVGEVFYTCNCGWFDTTHSQHKPGLQLLQNLSYVRNRMIENPNGTRHWGFAYPLGISSGIDAPVYGEISNNLFDHLALVSPTALLYGNLEAIAVSIFMEANLSFENEQGSFPYSLLPGLAASSFSEEDLPSDLIGFAAGLEAFRQGRSDVNEIELMEFVGRTCGYIFTIQESLEVWEKVYDNGAGLRYGREDGWKYFYPRILELNCGLNTPTGVCSKPRGYPGYMADLINSYIPSSGFKTEDYDRNGVWWWTWHDTLVWTHYTTFYGVIDKLHVPATSSIPSYLHFD